MRISILLSVLVQVGVLAYFFVRFGRSCAARIGFLFAAMSFLFHGLPEILLSLFPSSAGGSFRDFTSEEYLGLWIALVTTGLVAYCIAYSFTARKTTNSGSRLPQLLEGLDKVYFLRWQVIVGLAVPDFLYVALRLEDNAGGYWLSGLSNEYMLFLVVLSFATFELKYRGAGFGLASLLYVSLMALSGERARILAPVLLTLSAAARYGIYFPWRKLLFAAALVGAGFVSISLSRSVGGRFSAGEGIQERTAAIAEGLTASSGSTDNAVLSDTVYRFDGNSFGAIVLQRQADGYKACTN
jgi:hypothetical protein